MELYGNIRRSALAAQQLKQRIGTVVDSLRTQDLAGDKGVPINAMGLPKV